VDADPKGAIEMQLSNMMAASNENLAQAESHHTRALNKMRRQLTLSFSNEAKAVGREIAGYAQDLLKAEAVFSSAVNASKAGLNEASAFMSTKLGDMDSPVITESSKLSAKVGVAERTLMHAKRERARKVREAEESVEEIMEDDATKAGRELGDLSSLSDATKQSLEAEVSDLVANVTSKEPVIPRNSAQAAKTLKELDETNRFIASQFSLAQAAKTQEADEAKRLIALEGSLGAATKEFEKTRAAAGKKVQALLARAGKRFDAQIGVVQKGLDAAQHAELLKVAGKKA